MAAAGESAAPSTERNEWGRDARFEVPAQPLEVALRSLEQSSRRQDSVESLSEPGRTPERSRHPLKSSGER